VYGIEKLNEEHFNSILVGKLVPVDGCMHLIEHPGLPKELVDMNLLEQSCLSSER
jgi:hypothetical protein